MDSFWLEPDRHEFSSTPVEYDQTYDAVLIGWARALDARAQLPEAFSRRTALLAVRIARALGCDQEAIAHVHRGALLHDVGMMHVPDSILRKPGPLSPGEWALVRLHPMFADEILGPITCLRPASVIPRYHHERWDGTGYPYGLRADQIPLPARVFAVANAWATMTVDRPYRRSLAPERALRIITESSGTHFDPQVVAAFLTLLDQRVSTA